MAKIVWASDFMIQTTREARIAREILPRIRNGSDHEVVHFAVSGLSETMPFPLQGIDVYGTSGQGGMFGEGDFPLVDSRENAGVWLLNFDARPIRAHLQQMDLRYVLYPPVDHEPIAKTWVPCLENATEIVPYSEFGAGVLEEEVDAEDGGDTVRAPIRPGVDPETFAPAVPEKEDLFAVSEDTFVVGLFARRRNDPGNPVRQLRGFAAFLDENDLWDDAMLYIHTPPVGQAPAHFGPVLDRLGLQDNVGLPSEAQNRWAIQETHLPQLYNACDVVLNVTGGDAGSLSILESFATATPVIASGWSTLAEQVSGTPEEIRHDDEEVGSFVETDRGWVVPASDEHPTPDKDAWQRTFAVDDIEAALTHAYRHPNRREEKGQAGRAYATEHNWDRIADDWIAYFDGLEDRLFTMDDDGIEWGQVASEQGGLDAIGGDRSHE